MRKEQYSVSELTFDTAKDSGGNVMGAMIVAAGSHTTAGGAAAEAITVAGTKTTDFVFVSLNTAGAVPRTIASVAPTADTVTVTFSGDPSTDHVVYYMVVRSVA